MEVEKSHKHVATVFLSCGQQGEEAVLARQVQTIIEKCGFKCYNANEQHVFSDVLSIVENLRRADYYLFIDFKRKISKENHMPISVFTHQEFAIAQSCGYNDCIAFQEEGLDSYGLCKYLLVHPKEFTKQELVVTVQKHLKYLLDNKIMRTDFSRNLFVDGISPHDNTMYYYDSNGKSVEINVTIWHICVNNCKYNYAASYTTAILKSFKSPDGIVDDKNISLKWAKHGGQDAFHTHIFPGISEKFDAFIVNKHDGYIYLHSSCDIRGYNTLTNITGEYLLEYYIYSDVFSPIYYDVRIYFNHDKRSVEIIDTKSSFLPKQESR